MSTGTQWYELVFTANYIDYHSYYLKLTQNTFSIVYSANAFGSQVIKSGTYVLDELVTPQLILTDSLSSAVINLAQSLVSFQATQIQVLTSTVSLLDFTSLQSCILFYRGFNYDSILQYPSPYYKSAIPSTSLDALVASKTASLTNYLMVLNFLLTSLVVYPSFLGPINYANQTLSIDTSSFESLVVSQNLNKITLQGLSAINQQMRSTPNISTFLAGISAPPGV